jgi:hypothetical protein
MRTLASILGVIALVCAGLVFVSAAPVQAATPEDPTGFRFLTIGGGARAVGMAEAMVADSSDAFITEYNPAGLLGVQRFSISFSHNKFFQDTHGEYAALAVPMGKWALGARLAYVGTSDIPLRTGPSTDPLGLYDAASGIIQGAIARVVDDRLWVGLSAAYVLEHLESQTAQSGILGIGLRYRAHRNFHVGIAFANVGPKAKFVDQKIKMPNLLRLGGMWAVTKMSARGEIIVAENDNLRWNFGGEYDIDPRLAIRAGARIGYDTQVFDAGVGLRTSDGRIGIDYAFAPYSDDLGTTHRFGITVRP